MPPDPLLGEEIDNLSYSAPSFIFVFGQGFAPGLEIRAPTENDFSAF